MRALIWMIILTLALFTGCQPRLAGVFESTVPDPKLSDTKAFEYLSKRLVEANAEDRVEIQKRLDAMAARKDQQVFYRFEFKEDAVDIVTIVRIPVNTFTETTRQTYRFTVSGRELTFTSEKFAGDSHVMIDVSNATVSEDGAQITWRDGIKLRRKS